MSSPAALRLAKKVYQGNSQRHSPRKTLDGRVRSDQVRIPIRWLSGINTKRAEVMSKERCLVGGCRM